MRAHYESVARRGPDRSGYAEALKELKGPPFPESLRYLYDWALEICGRSGVSQLGVAPVTYSTIESWMRLTGNQVSRRELRVLIQLDHVLLHPGND